MPTVGGLPALLAIRTMALGAQKHNVYTFKICGQKADMRYQR